MSRRVAPERALGQVLREQGLTLAVAESCTGGMLGQRVTAVSGSSAYFVGGAIAYANRVKQAVLGVRASTLACAGAVSGATALEMAQGALRRFRADVAIAITGVAGPQGGTARKPVGLVYVGVAARGRRGRAWRFRFRGGRARVRSQAAAAALEMTLRFLSTPAAGRPRGGK